MIIAEPKWLEAREKLIEMRNDPTVDWTADHWKKARDNYNAGLEFVGGLSDPSKMPCYSWGTPAEKCHVGSRLAKVSGSICEECYALDNNYLRPNVIEAQNRRLNKYIECEQSGTVDKWEMSFVSILGYLRFRKRGAQHKWFRWFDSGDLYSDRQMSAIHNIAVCMPAVRFWLPTKEYGIIARYMVEHGKAPSNLTIRLSAAMINGPLPTIKGLPTSSADSVPRVDGTLPCPVNREPDRKACGDCRECWSPFVPNVSYKLH